MDNKINSLPIVGRDTVVSIIEGASLLQLSLVPLNPRTDHTATICMTLLVSSPREDSNLQPNLLGLMMRITLLSN